MDVVATYWQRLTRIVGWDDAGISGGRGKGSSCAILATARPSCFVCGRIWTRHFKRSLKGHITGYSINLGALWLIMISCTFATHSLTYYFVRSLCRFWDATLCWLEVAKFLFNVCWQDNTSGVLRSLKLRWGPWGKGVPANPAAWVRTKDELGRCNRG